MEHKISFSKESFFGGAHQQPTKIEGAYDEDGKVYQSGITLLES